MSDLTPPDDRDLRTAARVLAEALLSTNPATGFFVRYYQWAFPPDFESRLQGWRAKIADRIADNNEAIEQIQKLLTPKESLNDTSFEVARFLINNAGEGFNDTVDFDPLTAALP